MHAPGTRALLLAHDEASADAARRALAFAELTWVSNEEHDIVLAVASCREGLGTTVIERWGQLPYDAPRLVLALEADMGALDLTDLEAVCRRALDTEVLARWLPVLDDTEEMAGALDLLTLDLLSAKDGRPTVEPATRAHVDVAAEFIDEARTLVATGADAELFELFVDDQPISDEAWDMAFLAQVGEGALFPLLPLTGRGPWTGADLVARILEGLAHRPSTLQD